MASEIGLVGLGTMGAALSLNIAEKGFPVAVFNRTGSVTEAFVAGAGPLAGGAKAGGAGKPGMGGGGLAWSRSGAAAPGKGGSSLRSTS